MTSLFTKTALAIAGLGLYGLCAAQNVAIVNGKAIPKSRADAYMAQAAMQARRQGQQPPTEQQIKDELITREVLAQEARKRGLDSTDDIKDKLEMIRQSLLIQSLFEDERKANPTTDAQAKAKYNDLVKNLSGVEYHAHHILVEKEAEAKAVLASLKKGAKFEEIAKKQSKDTASGRNGGDLGWSTPSNYVKEFSDALVALKKGQSSSSPVKSQFGYHIIRLDDVRDTQPPKYEEVKQNVIQELDQEKVEKLIADLKRKAKIE